MGPALRDLERGQGVVEETDATDSTRLLSSAPEKGGVTGQVGGVVGSMETDVQKDG